MGGYSTRLIAAIMGLALAVGCSCSGRSDDAGTDEGTDAGTDVTDEAEDVTIEYPTGTGILTVQVVGAYRTMSGLLLENTADPVEGATVALDAPGGRRSELTTGADGRVTFEGLDWSAGTADVTVHEEGHLLRSMVQIDGSEEEVTVGLVPEDESDGFVEIHGRASNMSDADHQLAVYATSARTFTRDTGYFWSLMVEPGVDFTLVAAEHEPITRSLRSCSQQVHGWVVLDHAAVAEDTAVDIDFASPATPVNVSSSVAVPDVRAESPLAGSTSIYSVVNDEWLYVGFSEHTAPSTDGTAFDLDFEYVEPAGLSAVQTIYRVAPMDTYLGYSRVVVAGYPVAGTHDLGFLDLPDVHQNHMTYYPLRETEFSWDLYDSGVEVFLDINFELSVPELLRPLWRVDAPTDATSIRVPEPPSTFLETTSLEGTHLHAHVYLWTHPDGDGTFRFVSGQCLRMSM